jgi:hypothetical protein
MKKDTPIEDVDHYSIITDPRAIQAMLKEIENSTKD